jgi:uncharacterized protein YbbC (DUF1343 family)
MAGPGVKPGCEVFLENPPRWFRWRRMGLLANQASCTRDFRHVSQMIHQAGGRLACIFSPQHGFYAEKQANMVESDHGIHPLLGIPIYSLYGEVRRPTEEMLQAIDVLVVDLSDVGTRVYTFGTTLGLCVEAAAEAGLKVVVLDRPNPINGTSVEGNPLKPQWRSFVGRYPIPMRHGLTLGELARFVVREEGLDCDLEVIPAAGWRRDRFHPQTGLPWLWPSPNMPSWESALLYPGLVLLEGTNVSEGRGTTLPFQVFGAPFVRPSLLLNALDVRALDGVVLRPVCFEPTFDKWRGEVCYGFQVHVTEPGRVKPYRLGLAVLKAFLEVHADRFQWLPPPYEYEYEKKPIDILLGDGFLRERLQKGAELPEVEAGWQGELEAYRDRRQAGLMYP